jgi:hypothetical protein
LLKKLLTITVLIPALTIILTAIAGPSGGVFVTFVAFPVLLVVFVVACYLREDGET